MNRPIAAAHLAALLVLCALTLTLIPAAASADAPGLRQVAGVLDYVGSDYAGAVSDDGRILSQGEYDEQISLTNDAMKLVREAGVGEEDGVARGLRDLLAALERREAPARILALSREIKGKLVQDHGLVLTPAAAPDRARARELYMSQACNTCHGDDGGADTAAARALNPAPANFLDAERVAGVSPHRAFHALTFGVAGTGMVAYDRLSAQDRWSLAFFVLALRHQGAGSRGGGEILRARAPRFDASPAALSQATEDDLRAALSADIPSAEEREIVLSHLRGQAPFATTAGATFSTARALLARAVSAYRRSEREEARGLFVAAYLDGIEPNEATLRARDESLVLEIEREMLGLREAAGDGAPLERVVEGAAKVEALLDRAEDATTDQRGAFFGSMAIALREGLEAALLVVALLAFVRKRGALEQVKYVHAGWFLALPAGFLTWLIAGKAIGGLERELAEGIIALLAAAVLLGATHWILGQASSKQVMGFLARKVGAAGSGKGAAWAIFAMAFIAAYREAFEVVLFYRALLLDAHSSTSAVLSGAALGIGLLVVIVIVLKLVGQKLKPRPFMLASSAMLAVIALMLVGKGFRALQEAGVLGMTPLPLPEVPTIGLFATAEGLIAQGVLFLLLAGSALWPWLASRREAARQGNQAPTAS